MTHCSFQVLGLGRSHLIRRVVEHLFREEPQDGHIIFTYRQAGVAGGDDFVDESWPVMWPFLLENRHQNEVELVEKSSLGFEALLRAGALNDEIDHEISDP